MQRFATTKRPRRRTDNPFAGQVGIPTHFAKFVFDHAADLPASRRTPADSFDDQTAVPGYQFASAPSPANQLAYGVLRAIRRL